GVVDQDVEIPEPLAHELEQLTDLVLVRDVAAHHLSLNAKRARRGRGIRSLIRVPHVVDDHVRAPSRELEHDGAPDTEAAAGDQRQLAAQVTFAQLMRLALTLRSTLPWSAAEMGQVSLATSAAF